MGAHTCEFCMTLASRDLVCHTKETAGEFGRLHSDCRCKVVAGFPEMEFYFKSGIRVSRSVDPKVEGYDPNRLLDMYEHPERYQKAQEKAEATGSSQETSERAKKAAKILKKFAKQDKKIRALLRRYKVNPMPEAWD